MYGVRTAQWKHFGRLYHVRDVPPGSLDTLVGRPSSSGSLGFRVSHAGLTRREPCGLRCQDSSHPFIVEGGILHSQTYRFWQPLTRPSKTCRERAVDVSRTVRDINLVREARMPMRAVAAVHCVDKP